jgi:hypothetical protein
VVLAGAIKAGKPVDAAIFGGDVAVQTGSDIVNDFEHRAEYA